MSSSVWLDSAAAACPAHLVQCLLRVLSSYTATNDLQQAPLRLVAASLALGSQAAEWSQQGAPASFAGFSELFGKTRIECRPGSANVSNLGALRGVAGQVAQCCTVPTSLVFGTIIHRNALGPGHGRQ